MTGDTASPERRPLTIDSHQHFWEPARIDYPWLTAETPEIHRAFRFDDLLPHLQRNGVDGTVLVQAADHDADTEAMFEVASAHPEVLGVVAYVPLHDPAAAADRLAILQHRERFVGIRNLIHDRPDPDCCAPTSRRVCACWSRPTCRSTWSRCYPDTSSTSAISPSGSRVSGS